MKMYKLFFVLGCAFVLGGCQSGDSNILTENTAPPVDGNYNSQEVLQRIYDLKNGAAPVTKGSGSSQQSAATPPPPPPPPQPKPQPSAQDPEFEDLARIYDKALIKTNFGDIGVELYGDESPLTVNNFLNLARDGFYDGTKFHRVIPGFMIQGGDPNSKDDDWSDDGFGGPDYKFRDEINQHKLVRGSLAMANSGPNTNGSQFFIVTQEELSRLDGKHTNFGEVVLGMEAVDAIEALETNEDDHPLVDAVIESIVLVEKQEQLGNYQIE